LINLRFIFDLMNMDGIPTNISAIQLNRYGSIQELQHVRLPRPDVAPDAVLVRNMFIGINPYDCMARQGKMWFLEGFQFPKILGCESAGVVTDVGHRVQGLQPGDRVVVFHGRRGAYAEYVSVAAKNVVKLPPELPLEEAVGLPLVGTVAWDVVTDLAGLRPGQHILITGAGGALGMYAIQFAKQVGATVTAVCRAEKINAVRQMGADYVFDRATFSRAGQNYHAILDSASMLDFFEVRENLQHGGVMVAVLPGPKPMFQQLVSRPTQKQLKVLFGSPTLEKIKRLIDQLKAGNLKPIPNTEFSFEAIREAHELCESGAAIGKVILRV
jgi:NADPH:quinone reductase-like Zn-dependent oxidoreductase